MPRVIVSTARTTKNPGKTYGKFREVDILNKLAEKTVPHLRTSGILTLAVPRELDDKAKIDWINKSGYKSDHGDLVVNLTFAQSDGKTMGLTSWVDGKDRSKAEKASKTILDNISNETKLSNRGIADKQYKPIEPVREFLTKATPIPIVLGIGFIDNKKDQEYLTDENNIETLGKAIAKGITKHLNVDFTESKPKEKKQPTPRPSNPMIKPPSSLSNAPGFATGKGIDSFSKPGGFARPTGGGPPMASREDRKKMINENYIKILGREPNQSDLNYFLNTGITEDKLIKKMLDSQEHADLVKARQEVLTTKSQFHIQQAEILQLRAANDDKTNLINNLNALIAQKNKALTELYKKVQQFQTQPQKDNSEQGKLPEYKKSFSDRVLDFFTDRLG